MALKKETKRQLKRLGLEGMNINDERTANFYINFYLAKENASLWKREVEEANRKAIANWPSELHTGIKGVEVASGCEFLLCSIEETLLQLRTTNRRKNYSIEVDCAYFLERINAGYLKIDGYSPKT